MRSPRSPLDQIYVVGLTIGQVYMPRGMRARDVWLGGSAEKGCGVATVLPRICHMVRLSSG